MSFLAIVSALCVVAQAGARQEREAGAEARPRGRLDRAGSRDAV